jgi:ubiquinone/menaquinone biosynthesis C-methylase UbiE
VTGVSAPVNGRVRRAVTAKVVAQFHRPTGLGGRLAGWEMAARSSNRRRNRWVVSLLDLTATSRVLEIGFGPGIALREAARRAVEGTVIGVDHSPVMLRQATRRNAAAIRAGRVRLYLGSADELPPLDGGFDRIYAVNSIGFWNDPDACLVTLRGLLGPNGRTAIASQPRSPGATADATARAGDEIAGRLANAGFTAIRRETLALDPPVVCVIGE